MTQQPASAARYIQATRGDVAFMKVVRWLTDHGVSLMGSRVLTVRGRKTGTPQSVPVNLLTLDGRRYLVAPRGHTQWVRNVADSHRNRSILQRLSFRCPMKLSQEGPPEGCSGR